MTRTKPKMGDAWMRIFFLSFLLWFDGLCIMMNETGRSNMEVGLVGRWEAGVQGLDLICIFRLALTTDGQEMTKSCCRRH